MLMFMLVLVPVLALILKAPSSFPFLLIAHSSAPIGTLPFQTGKQVMNMHDNHHQTSHRSLSAKSVESISLLGNHRYPVYPPTYHERCGKNNRAS
jgi:hypothetical protein